MMLPYLRSVIARGGRSVMSCRNFTSSLSKKEPKPDTKTTIEIKADAISGYLVLGFGGWVVWESYDLTAHYVIPHFKAEFSREEAKPQEANDIRRNLCA